MNQEKQMAKPIQQRSNNLSVVQKPQVSFPSQMEWQQIIDISVRAFKSGLLPGTIRNVEAASIIALKAWELNIPPMMGYAHIFVVNGKPGFSAELMQTLARRNLPGIQIIILESTDKKCAIKIQRPERGSIPFTFTFTFEDAQRAKLLDKDNWKQYPKAMLFSRTISMGLREICPDALMGASYTPEELENINAIETTGRPVEEPQPEPQPQVSEPVVQEVPKEESLPAWSITDQHIHDLTVAGNMVEVSFAKIEESCGKKFNKKVAELNQEEYERVMNWLKEEIKRREVK